MWRVDCQWGAESRRELTYQEEIMLKTGSNDISSKADRKGVPNMSGDPSDDDGLIASGIRNSAALVGVSNLNNIRNKKEVKSGKYIDENNSYGNSRESSSDEGASKNSMTTGIRNSFTSGVDNEVYFGDKNSFISGSLNTIQIGNEYKSTIGNKIDTFNGNQDSFFFGRQSSVINGVFEFTVIGDFIDYFSGIKKTYAYGEVHSYNYATTHEYNEAKIIKHYKESKEERCETKKEIVNKRFEMTCGNTSHIQDTDSIDVHVGNARIKVKAGEISLSVGDNEIALSSTGIRINGSRVEIG